MQAVLVRVGVDAAYGHWNAPADPESRRFVYVPIPEGSKVQFHSGCRRGYGEFVTAVDRFVSEFGSDLRIPIALRDRSAHLDPDFDFLTYGDRGSRRGSDLQRLADGDLVIFYAGMRSVRRTDKRLIYGLIGLYVVQEIVVVGDVAPDRRDENAHTRKLAPAADDIVVRARPGVSGRLDRFIPIGEYRDRAYRVRRDILDEWGGLTVKNGYIQRSARPPRMLDALRFKRWFDQQCVQLLQTNN